MRRFLTWLLFCTMFLACLPAAHGAASYPDGIYRGFYYDGGIEQIAIQFELREGLFSSILYRGVKYKDGDYMSEDASDAQKATLRQYLQLADYLVGKGVDAIDDLYTPYEIVEDVDAVTTATMHLQPVLRAAAPPWSARSRSPAPCRRPAALGSGT